MAIEYFSKFYEGYVNNFEWGCFDHDHNAYAIIEAESHENARMSVPPLLRDKAKVIKLERFTPEIIHSILHGHGEKPAK